MFGGNDPHAPVYEKLSKEFADEKKIVIEDSSAVSDEAWKTKVMTSFQNGDEPDVLYYFTGAAAKPLIDENKVVPVAEIQNEVAKYGANINSAYSNPYCVTLKGMVEGMFVNTSLFTDDLATYLEKDSWTWDEFMDISTKLNAKEVTPVALGAIDIPHYWIEHAILAKNGPEAFKKIPTEAEFKEADGTKGKAADGWIDALKLFNVAAEANVFGTTKGDQNNESATQSFLDGKSAMYIDGSWFAGSIKDTTKATPSNVKMYPFPTFADKDGNHTVYTQSGFTSGFYITRKAWENPAKKQLAIDFVLKQTSAAAIKDYCVAAFGIPADESVKLDNLTALQQSMVDLLTRTKANTTLPLSDQSAAGSFADLVSASNYFLKADLNQI